MKDAFLRFAGGLGFAAVISGCATYNINAGPCGEGGGGSILGTGAHSYGQNTTCLATNAAKDLYTINDPGTKAVGILMLENTLPPAKEAGDRVRRALVNQKEAPYTIKIMPDGSARLVGGPLLMTVPQSAADAANSAFAPANAASAPNAPVPAASAPAPAPAPAP